MMNYGQLIVLGGLIGAGLVVWVVGEVLEVRRKEAEKRRKAEHRLIYLQAMDDLWKNGAQPEWLDIEKVRKELRELGGTAGGPRDE